MRSVNTADEKSDLIRNRSRGVVDRGVGCAVDAGGGAAAVAAAEISQVLLSTLRFCAVTAIDRQRGK